MTDDVDFFDPQFLLICLPYNRAQK
jgi:hypothetical protein